MACLGKCSDLSVAPLLQTQRLLFQSQNATPACAEPTHLSTPPGGFQSLKIRVQPNSNPGLSTGKLNSSFLEFCPFPTLYLGRHSKRQRRTDASVQMKLHSLSSSEHLKNHLKE